MTTIATDGTQIVWDGQATIGNIRHDAGVDKVIILNGLIYACCGDATAAEIAPVWHSEGAKKKKTPEGEWGMLVIFPNGVIRYYGNESPTGHVVSFPYAIGSGGEIALIAMKMGMDAQKAVAKACEMDIYSGPPIKTLFFNDVWESHEWPSLAKPKSTVKKTRARSRSTSSRATPLHSKT